MRSVVVAKLAGLVALGALSACVSGPEPTFDGPVYPTDVVKLETLDIQVLLGPTDLTLTSGAGRRLGPVTVWLNRWFATEINGLEPGEQLVLPLHRFQNENGLSPKGGGFFATRERDEIVLVELISEEGLFGVRLLGERR